MPIQNYKLGVEITGDASQLEREAKKAEKAVDGIAKKGTFGTVASEVKKVAGEFNLLPQSLTSAESSLSTVAGGFTGVSAVAGPVGLAVGGAAIAFTATAGAAIGLGTTLFNLARQASDYGSEIKDFQDKTGLAAETISTLKFNAEASGIAFDALQAPIGKFTKLMYDADNGSTKAQATLAKFNVTDFSDIDGGLSKVFDGIHNAGTETEKTGLAMDVFGKKTGQIMRAVADNVDGDLGKAIARAKELGITLSEEDVKAADDFGDTLALLGTQATTVSAKFALQFAPQITAAMSDISDWFSQNQDTVLAWGETTSNVFTVIRETVVGAGAVYTAFGDVVEGVLDSVGYNLLSNETKTQIWAGTVRQSLSSVTYGLSEVLYYFQAIGKAKIDSEKGISAKADASSALLLGLPGEFAPKIPKTGGGGGGRRGGGGGGGGKARGGKTSTKSPAELATDDLKKLDVQMLKDIRLITEQTDALSANTKFQDSQKLAIELQSKGYDKLVPSKYAHIIALAQEKEALQNVFDQQQKITDQYKTATEKYDDFVKSQLKLISDAKGETNEFAEILKDLNETVFNVVENAQKFKFPNAETIQQTQNFATDVQSSVAQGELSPVLRGKGKNVKSLENSSPNSDIINGVNNDSQFMPPLDGVNNELQTISTNAQDAVAQIQNVSNSFLEFNVESEKSATNYLLTQRASAEIFTKVLGVSLKSLEPAKDLLGLENSKIDAVNDYIIQLESVGIYLDAEIKAKALEVALNKDNLELEKRRLEVMKQMQPLRMKDPGEREQKTTGIPFFSAKVSADNLKGALAELAQMNSDGMIFKPEDIQIQVDALGTLKNAAMDAFGGIVQGLGQTLENWILTGEISGQAIAQMTASVIAGVAAQAGVKAIFEVAEGIAAAANPFTAWQTPIHFAAAKTYGLVALGATAVGLGLGAAGGIGGKKNNQNSASTFGGNEKKDDEYTRGTQFANFGGNRQDSNSRLASAIENFNNKFSTVSSGQVLMSGMKERRGAVVREVIDNLKSDLTLKNEIGRTLYSK
jgi:hypothetical protein